MTFDGEKLRVRLADLRRMAERFPNTPAGVQALKELAYLERKERATTARGHLPVIVG